MRREVRYALAALRRRPTAAFLAWSVPEAVPAALSGLAVARAVDAGFLAGRPLVGLAWLAALLGAAGVGALGARQVYRRLGDLVEPFRDDLVRHVVRGALRRGVAGRPDDGAVARLTHQVEIVRDTYAGLVVVVRGFVVTAVGATVGLASTAPVVGVLVGPPFLLGLGAFLATLGVATGRQRAYVRSDERLAGAAGAVLAGLRDVTGVGAEDHAAALVGRPVAEQAAAELALARVGALRTLCLAVGGWGPLLVLLAAGPWLVGRGLTAGALLGALTYVLVGLQPALGALVNGLGGGGLRFVVTLGRILDAGHTSTPDSGSTPRPAGPGSVREGGIRLRGVTFAYGPHSEPVLRDLDLDIPEGDHLAVVGPSGIGKSTLAGLLCGLRAPDAGTVTALRTDQRVLIPQEAYVFTGTVGENLRYLRPDASAPLLDDAVAALGADALLARLGGYSALLSPASLSAGERQLLALVRAYLADAPVVVLDEATCHLDAEAERRAEEAFAARGGTVVVIAHRISSASRARRVLVLDGVTAAVGDHDTVLAASPLYRELLGHWRAGQTQPAP
ncbi:ABC transporter ATP-binding protein [Longispora fulva]|uniref:ATP-binding cassette subfamily C protein n=1 Tax=Longispora fulva TaxID=619741 RepID=A0A8J7GA74_9ACTN|nr:ABC transporter ATP-binding protein [Longispora fulva]MBG6135215.1 ATP-binding cassette subfamily C protein [Longispora fulva]GIG56550.1 ABC transporter ATP-binding protein [Longispora fulva]